MRQTPFFPLWQRYFFKEIGKTFFPILLLFFVLFTAIDYSIHMQGFIKSQAASVKEIAIYYFFQFFKRMDILLPLSLLVSIIKLLTTLNQRKELVALRTAGLTSWTLLRPLFLLTLLASSITLANFEWIIPHSLSHIETFYKTELKSKKKKTKPSLQISQLSDGSKLIYQSQDQLEGSLFDCLWIRSAHEFWKIKHLNEGPSHPVAHFADHFTKNEIGFFEKQDSHSEITLKELHWSPNMARKRYASAEMLPISKLVLELKTESPLYQREALLTHLLFKCAMPLIAPIALLALAPACIAYRRKIPYFTLYSLFLLSLIILTALMDALVILGENLILPPFWAISTPFLVLGLLFGFRFGKAIRS